MFSAGKSAIRMLLKNGFPCNKPCEFCDQLKAIKAQPKMTEFLKSDTCKVFKDIVVDKAQGNNSVKSCNFVNQTLKSTYDTCFAHAGPIARKERVNIAKFQDTKKATRRNFSRCLTSLIVILGTLILWSKPPFCRISWVCGCMKWSSMKLLIGLRKIGLAKRDDEPALMLVLQMCFPTAAQRHSLGT